MHVGRLIGAACMVLAASAANAVEPRHLDAQPVLTKSDGRSRCVAALVDAGVDCTVGAFGPLETVAGHAFFFADYDVKPTPGGPVKTLPYRRVVVFQAVTSGMLRPILISSDDPAFIYGKPKTLRSNGRILLHIPAAEDGTGNFNRELLYVWDKDGWRDVDVTSWLNHLKRRLPKGLDALKGIFPDYVTMKARTPIWHAASDSNACATAGYADISLAWSADRIVLTGLRLHRPKRALNDQGCFE
jgi:hypothetical protein